jgi:hypothetical protein
LQIVAGGRAEIDDAIVVGDQGGSVGLIEVDGLDSLLSNAASDGIIDGNIDAAGLTVGRLGSGTMYILNRGRVFTRGFVPTTGGGSEIVAGVIGGDRYDGTTPPEAGWIGNVYVDGIGSSWILAGDLQIGGFHANHDPITGDLEGDDAIYASNVGRGTLTVSNGGLVSIVPPDESTTGMAPDELNLLIGRFGIVDMQGGRIQVQSGFEPGGGNPDPLIDDVQIINDGTIKGYGEIDTGIFVNRYFGRVEVDPGQSLLISANSEELPPMHREALVNYGVIQVHGTEDFRASVEFDHEPDMLTDISHAFHNYRLSDPPPAPVPSDVYGGLITARHATLSFRSGLDNHAILAFTDGSNYVQGIVLNEGALNPLGEGRINVWGSGVKATFENELLNLGTLDIAGGADVDVLGRHSFVTAGNMSVELNAQDLSQIFVAGDAGIAGRLTISLANFSLGSLSAGDTFPLLSVTGGLGGVDLSNPFQPQVDLTVPPLFTELVMPDLTLFGAAPGLEMIPVYTTNSVLLAILSTVGIVGADFNGDGIVDNFDLDILRMNFGITMGATALQGDANGDGRVDGRDFFLWQSQVGGPGMGSAPAGVVGGGGGTVPEPGSLTLALFGGLLALAASRRRLFGASRG